jgi:hypothetical protein
VFSGELGLEIDQWGTCFLIDGAVSGVTKTRQRFYRKPLKVFHSYENTFRGLLYVLCEKLLGVKNL